MTDLKKKMGAAAASLKLKLEAVLADTPEGATSKDTILGVLGLNEDELALLMTTVQAKVAAQARDKSLLKPGRIPFQYSMDLLAAVVGLARRNFELEKGEKSAAGWSV